MDDKRFETLSPDADLPREDRSEAGADQEKPKRRPTVHVNSGAGRPLKIQLHQVVPDDGAGRAFLGRMPEEVELRAGGNAGVDKEFMDRWLAQNEHMARQMNITAADEDDPDELAERDRRAVDQDFIDDAEAGAAAANQE